MEQSSDRADQGAATGTTQAVDPQVQAVRLREEVASRRDAMGLLAEASRLAEAAAAEADEVVLEAQDLAARLVAEAQERAEAILVQARAEATETRAAARVEADRLAADLEQQREEARSGAARALGEEFLELRARAERLVTEIEGGLGELGAMLAGARSTVEHVQRSATQLDDARGQVDRLLAAPGTATPRSASGTGSGTGSGAAAAALLADELTAGGPADTRVPGPVDGSAHDRVDPAGAPAVVDDPSAASLDDAVEAELVNPLDPVPAGGSGDAGDTGDTGLGRVLFDAEGTGGRTTSATMIGRLDLTREDDQPDGDLPPEPDEHRPLGWLFRQG